MKIQVFNVNIVVMIIILMNLMIINVKKEVYIQWKIVRLEILNKINV